MGFINLTCKQLEQLETPDDARWREPAMLTRNSSGQAPRPEIESLEECRTEDGRRAEGFETFATKYEVWADEDLPFDPYWTHKLLLQWESGQGNSPAIASATYLRNRRLALTKGILELV